MTGTNVTNNLYYFNVRQNITIITNMKVWGLQKEIDCLLFGEPGEALRKNEYLGWTRRTNKNLPRGNRMRKARGRREYKYLRNTK